MSPSYIWRLNGPVSGPTVAVLGGTHGDELAGVHVVRRLLQLLDVLQRPAGEYRSAWVRGSLFLGFGNPQAIVRRTRGASSAIDLNRCFYPDPLSVAPSEGEPMDLTRAREIAPVLNQVELLVDLHGTSLPSEPFVCLGDVTPRHLDIIGLVPVRRIITDPDCVLARDEGKERLPTTDQYVNGRGGIAFAYETGREDDISVVDDVLLTVLRTLLQFGAVEPSFLDECHLELVRYVRPQQQVYRLAAAVQATEAVFSYAPGMDRSWTTVSAGQTIGHYGSGEEVRALQDGVLLLQKSPLKVRVGKTLYYLALQR